MLSIPDKEEVKGRDVEGPVPSLAHPWNHFLIIKLLLNGIKEFNGTKKIVGHCLEESSGIMLTADMERQEEGREGEEEGEKV